MILIIMEKQHHDLPDKSNNELWQIRHDVTMKKWKNTVSIDSKPYVRVSTKEEWYVGESGLAPTTIAKRLDQSPSFDKSLGVEIIKKGERRDVKVIVYPKKAIDKWIKNELARDKTVPQIKRLTQDDIFLLLATARKVAKKHRPNWSFLTLDDTVSEAVLAALESWWLKKRLNDEIFLGNAIHQALHHKNNHHTDKRRENWEEGSMVDEEIVTDEENVLWVLSLLEDWENKKIKEFILSCLDAREGKIFDLRIEQELTFDEVAEEIDLPVATVKSKYRRGLEKIRNILKKTQLGKNIQDDRGIKIYE